MRCVSLRSWCHIQRIAGNKGNPLGRHLGWVLNTITRRDYCREAVLRDVKRCDKALDYLASAQLAWSLAEWEESLKK